MKTITLPLVDWGMGAILIGVFALVCVVLVLVVYSMSRGDKKKSDTTDETSTEL